MAYKSILVHVTARPQAGQAVEAAVDLAGRFDAHLLGVGAEMYDLGVMANVPYIDVEAAGVLRTQCETNLDAARARFEQLAAPLTKHEWISELDYPGAALALYSRRADLVVACRPDPDNSAMTAIQPADLIVQAGVPVLLTPSTPRPFEGRKIVVGWKDTRESRRALSDGLPFFVRAECVSVVAVAADGEASAGGGAVVHVAERLRRHGAEARPVLLEDKDGSIAETLHRYAASEGADLLVMGAFSRSRAREWAFGGVTQEVMGHSDHYVLLSH